MKMREATSRASALAAAKEAQLRYWADFGPAIIRHKKGKGAGLRMALALQIHILERIAKLAIPPAWTEVRICPSPLGHIQTTDRDARGRKQYRFA